MGAFGPLLHSMAGCVMLCYVVLCCVRLKGGDEDDDNM